MPARVASTTVDAVVIGGGPAGASVARQLAASGHQVVVLPGPPPRQPGIAESLPPSCRKPLAALGLLDAIDRAGFLPTRGNSSAWAERDLRAQGFGPGEAGLQVVRSRFDDVLLREAARGGARVLDGAAARRVELPPDVQGESPSTVRWSAPDGEGTLRARWVLDCSGRSGVLARQGFRVREAAPATAALLGVWRRQGRWPLDDPSHTVVESYRDGWVWSVPVDPSRRYVAAMVDPRLTSTDRSGGVQGMYLAELAKTEHLRRLLDGAVPEGSAWACAATRYRATRHGGNGFLLVGDAGCFLDPLSSIGVKKALASGYLAAVVVHTCLTRPEMRGAALELFEERERAAHAGYAALTARHYAEAAAVHAHPFWTARAAAPAPADAPGGDPDRWPRDPRVAAALRSLQSAPEVRLRPTAGLRRVPRPTVEGGEVVLHDHLASAAAPRGVRIVTGVDVARLVGIAGEFDRVPDLFEAYGRAHAPVPLPDFLCALSTLLALGMLENQSDS